MRNAKGANDMDTFHIADQRVEKINEPLLVIGLGGTGTDALLNVMDKFKHRFVLPKVNDMEQEAPARTAYLSLDTDSTVLTQKRSGDTVLNNNEFFDLSLPNMSDLLNPRRARALLKSYEQAWLDKDLQSLNAAFGAGGVRQCGRFMLCKKVETLVRRLQTIIQGLMAVTQGDDDKGSITVVVMAGLGGGTGSGTFLDVAYLIRHVMETFFFGKKLTLMGFFILPDVNLSHAHYSDASKKVLRTNGFAALKELDFWMNYDSHKYTYVHKYTEGVAVQWTQPYNDVVLLGERNEDGTVIKNAYDVVLDTISETLMHFMAQERNRGTEGFTYQSHKVNVQGAVAHLNKAYPVNYCYMAIGAASTESQRNSMVVYEAKLTFDSLVALEQNESLLKTFFPETFHRTVLPDTEDPYTLFDAVSPLPPFFHGEPGFSYAEVRNMLGDGALHGEPLNAYLHGVRISVNAFGRETLDRLWERFRQNAVAAIRDPQKGPFRFEEYLKDVDNGFVRKLESWKQFWLAESEMLLNASATERARVDGQLYPAMINVPLIERIITERRARFYIQGCEVLFTHARNQIVADKMHEVYQTLLSRARNYANINLTTFNRMTQSLRGTLSEEVAQMKAAQATADTQMITFTRLQQYVDGEFAKLKGGLNQTTEKVLEQLAEMSFGLQIDGTTNRVADIDAKQHTFSAMVEEFVGESFRTVNHVKLDGVLDMTMPDASENDRVRYVATVLLPRLRNSARTMYQTHAAMQGVANSYIDYSYVSVPFDADIMKKGLQMYRDSGEPITPKESEITDRLYWLRTYNCLPLCRFATLTTLERDYEESLANAQVHGLHLVYNVDNPALRNRLSGTWKVLPSPLPHMLLGETPSRRQLEQAELLQSTIRKAFELGIVKFMEHATPDGVLIHLKMDSGGNLMEDETFCELVNSVMANTETSDQQKREALVRLQEGRSDIELTFGDYVDEFAKSLRLTVMPAANTEGARREAAENRLAVRRYIAGYMIALRPELLEQIEGQLHMFDEYSRAMAVLEAREREFRRMEEYAARLSQMMFLGMVRSGFGAFKFDMVDEPDQVLFLHSQIKAAERTLPPVLALLSALAEDDGRIEPMKRNYLEEQATKRLSRLDKLTEEEQRLFKERARAFVEAFDGKPEQMRFDAALTAEQRDKQSRLLSQMIGTARQYMLL
jgi:hypothetical protein